MVIKGPGNTRDLLKFGSASCAPVYNQVQQEVLPFLFKSGKGQSVYIRCFSNALGNGTSVCPSLSINSEDGEENKTGQGDTDPGPSSLAETAMIYGPASAVVWSLQTVSSPGLLSQQQGRILHPELQSLHLMA